MKPTINIKLDENDLDNVLKAHIKDSNMRKIILDIVSNSHQGIEWIFKIHLGKAYPNIPKNGTSGYVHVDNISSWSGNLLKYQDSEFNQHGFIPVIVREFRGLNEYYPLRVVAPKLNQNFIEGDNVFLIDPEHFMSGDEFDAYEPCVAKSGE